MDSRTAEGERLAESMELRLPPITLLEDELRGLEPHARGKFS